MNPTVLGLDPAVFTTRVVNFFGLHPWAVWVVVGLLVASFVRSLLIGGYPTDQGVPPRWVSALVLALAPYSFIVKGVGRWAAGKLSFFGFDFLSEKTFSDSLKVVAEKSRGKSEATVAGNGAGGE